MKRMIVGILLLFLLTLTGCTTRRDWMYTMDQYQTETFQKMIDSLISALNTQDSAAIESLFAPNVQSAVTDESIVKLLAFTKGKTLHAEWNGLTSGGESRIDGKITGEVIQSFDLYVDGVPYDCWMKIVYRCDTDADEVGVHVIRLASDYVRCDEKYVWPKGNGLHVLTESGDAFATRRVGGRPYIWMDMERRVSEKDVKALLQDGITRQDVISVLGEPNAWDEFICCIYQMESVDGEARFVTFYGRQDAEVSSVSVDNERKWLYSLWESKKK